MSTACSPPTKPSPHQLVAKRGEMLSDPVIIVKRRVKIPAKAGYFGSEGGIDVMGNLGSPPFKRDVDGKVVGLNGHETSIRPA